MASFVGRKVILTWGGVVIPGCRTKSLSISGAPIDITSDDDNGWRTLLEDPAQNEANWGISGVTKDASLKNDWFSGDRTKPLVQTYPDGTTVSSMAYLASYKDNGTYNDAVTFDAEFQSTGEVTFTGGA